MKSPRPAQSPSSLLLPFLQATSVVESQRHLECLVNEHAGPVIRRILARRWRVSPSRAGCPQSLDEQDAEDIYSEVIAQVLDRLRHFQECPSEKGIVRFLEYVAVTTYHACDRHLRQKYPRRWSLKNRLRYLLTHHEGFALWQHRGGEWLAGFAAWREEERIPSCPDRLQQLRDHPRALVCSALAAEEISEASPADLLAAIFRAAAQPVEIDTLVSAVTELWGIQECPGQADSSAETHERLPDPTADVAREVDERIYLQRLWEEIRQLPPRQGAALLLNLRDARGRGVIALLPLMGVATLRQIAEALALPAEQFAALWNDLPLEDTVIAEQIGITRQQVINLRKVARERLARRMKAAGY